MSFVYDSISWCFIVLTVSIQNMITQSLILKQMYKEKIFAFEHCLNSRRRRKPASESPRTRPKPANFPLVALSLDLAEPENMILSLSDSESQA